MKNKLIFPLQWGAAALGLAILAGLLITGLWSSHKATLRFAAIELLHEAQIQGQHIDVSLRLVDFSVREVTEDLRESFLRAARMPERGQIQTLLRRHQAASQMSRLVVYGSDGNLIGAAGLSMPQLTTVVQHGFFLSHRDRLVPFLIETAEQLGQPNRPLIGVSRAIVAHDGRFLGIVLGVLNLAPLLRSDFDERGAHAEVKALFNADDSLLVSWSQGETAIPGSTEVDTILGSQLHPQAASPTPSEPWITALYQLTDFPLRLGMALSQRTVVAGWWAEVRAIALTLIASEILLAILLARLVVQSKRRRQAEENVRDQLAFQQTLLDTVPLPIFYKDTDFRYLGCNAAFEAAFGCRREDLVGVSSTTFFSPEEAADHERIDQSVLNSCKRMTYEGMVREVDGTDHYVIFHKAIFNRSDGSPGGILGAFMDITDHKRAEERMAALLKALEYSPSSIVITDVSGAIQYVNSRFTAVTGYDPQEVIGKNSSLLKSGLTPIDTYNSLWSTITKGKVWHGEFRNRAKSGKMYWERADIAPILSQDGQVVSYVAIKEDITAEKEAAFKIWEQANFDCLTGLANRLLFHRHLAETVEAARQSGSLVAILYIDLDRFKPVNDTYGHDAGDELLKQVAGRLKGCVRNEKDVVARLGGDEFAVLTAIRGDDDAIAMGERILDKLGKPFRLSVAMVDIGASIGISLFPGDAASAEDLLRHADAAMYSAKQAGRQTMRLFQKTP
ncbi:MAG TPA: diguanylate cyclase [Azospirillaceae bacterium]|nr:diguanylate cyclase [Azospirillaceae bacterium]